MTHDRYSIFSKWMQEKGFVKEHKFHNSRKWRLDYAHIPLAIGLEVEGGIWMKISRHRSPTGFLNDISKYNEATLDGWAVLRCTPQMIEDGTAYQLVERALEELDPFKRG